ncbi:hypothetical protein [Kitasatospora sp. LaBMicrA B282]|uniref:hypothetical protein n=1 Tax=Kitasatospora sp. LaBMicrA B282 TaxID=3420949 RepID=UPI003D0D907E
MDEGGTGGRSGFLAALGVAGTPEQDELLQRELELLADPRARAAARRQEPLDTLVGFLAGTGLAVPPAVLGRFRVQLAAATRQDTAPDAAADRSPREAVHRCLTGLFGRPAESLAAQLELLIADCGADGRVLHHWTVRTRYAEAYDLCQVWALALDEPLNLDLEPAATVDEVYATEAALAAKFGSEAVDGRAGIDGPDGQRVAVADLVGELTELVLLDRWALVDWRHWTTESPSLGWPAVLVQAQYRLRQLASATLPSSGTTRPVEPTPPVDPTAGRHGQAHHLLAAHAPDRQHIRRSHQDPTPDATRLQLADLAWAVRRRAAAPGSPAAPARTADRLAELLRHHPTMLPPPPGTDRAPWPGPVPGPDRLPFTAWELRERFPGLRCLLGHHRELLRRGPLEEYHTTHLPELLVRQACAAHLRSSGAAPGRAAAALAGELAALAVLFTGDAQLDQAVALLGEPPRDADPQVPWWDLLGWPAWLRAAVAELALPDQWGRTSGSRSARTG